MLGAHRITVALGAALASLYPPVPVLALVTHPTLDLSATLTNPRAQVTLLRQGTGRVTTALSTATAREPIVKRQTPVAHCPRNPGPTLTLASVSVTEGTHGANLVTVALSAPGSDGSEAIYEIGSLYCDDSEMFLTFALTTRPPHVLLFTETLASPRVALGGLAAVLVALTGFTEAVSRVAIVARQAGVTMPSSSVPQAGQALSKQ